MDENYIAGSDIKYYPEMEYFFDKKQIEYYFETTTILYILVLFYVMFRTKTFFLLFTFMVLSIYWIHPKIQEFTKYVLLFTILALLD